MKFGKHIRDVAYPPWADRYVDYKGLKRLLKPLENGNGSAEEESLFVAALYAETDKVDTFFTAKESEFFAEFRLFCIQVNETKVDCCRQRCATLEEVVQAYDGTPAGVVIRSFAEYTHKLETLRKYVMINVLAIIKITKKHDKHSRQAIQTQLVKAVHGRYFYKSDKFGTLITDVEVLAMQLMSRLADQKISAENLVCPSCVQVLCNPIMLPCGHRFCMKCVSASSYFKKGYKCPVCLKEHTLDLDSVRYGSMLAAVNTGTPSREATSWGLNWRPPPVQAPVEASLTHPAEPAAAAQAPVPQRGCRDDIKDQIVYRHVCGGGGSRRDDGGLRRDAAAPAAAPAGAHRPRRGGGDGGKGRGDTAERVIEESILRSSAVPDLSQSALSMSPDSVDGFSLVESLHDRHSRAQHSVTGMTVRASSTGALVVADITPGGPAARCGAVRRGDVVVAVDPGRGCGEAYWHYDHAGNRRWIDVRGWPEMKLPELMEGEAGTSLWLRVRRGEREVVAHLIRGPAGSSLFAPRPLDLVLVAADGERVTVPVDVGLELRAVRDAFNPDLPARTPVDRSPAAGSASSPGVVTGSGGQASWGGDHRARGSGRSEGGGGGGAARGEGLPREGLSSSESLSFQIVDGSGLCTAANVRAVLSLLDAGYASSLHSPPPPEELEAAVRRLLSLPDPRVIGKRLARSVGEAQDQLAATEAALSDARRHLVPLLSLPDLTRHSQLAIALGHVRMTIRQLEHERQQLTDKLSTKEARQTARRLARARARAQWAALPSVVTWAGAGARMLEADSDGPDSRAEIDRARVAVLESLERVCVLLRVAAALQVPRVVRALTRQVANALVECDDGEQLLAAVGVDADDLLPDEAAEAAAALEQVCQGDVEAASPLAVALCRAAVPRVASRSPLRRLGEGLLMALVDEIDDSGWRYRTAAGDRGGGSSGGGAGRSSGEECTCLIHSESGVLVQLRHRTRRASLLFRPAVGGEVHRCDSGGGIEAGALVALDLVRDLESHHPCPAPTADGTGLGGPGGNNSGGRVRRVPADGLGQVGEWATCVQRGRIVCTNGGSALHLTRGGGFVYLPSRDNGAAVVLEGGWVRAVARNEAVVRLMDMP